MNPCLSLSQVDRYEEYPKMRELIQRKDSLVAQRATPPYFIQAGTLPTLRHPILPCPKDCAIFSPKRVARLLKNCSGCEYGDRD